MERGLAYISQDLLGETLQVMELCALKDRIILNRTDGTQSVLWKMV